MEFDSMMKGFVKRMGAVILVFFASCFSATVFLISAEKSNHGVFAVLALGFLGIAIALGVAFFLHVSKIRAMHRILELIARARDETHLIESLYGEDVARGVVHGVLAALGRTDLLVKYKAYVHYEYKRLRQQLHDLDVSALDAEHIAVYGKRLKAIEGLSIFRLPTDESSISDRSNEISQNLIAAMNARKG